MRYPPVLDPPLHRRGAPTKDTPTVRGTRRSRWGLLVAPLVVGLALCAILWRVHTAAREHRLRQIARLDDAALAHDRVDAFFRGDSTALARGFLSLESSSGGPERRISRLKLLDWSLDDDYLLEMKGHHRASLRDEGAATAFSLHEWIAHPDRAGWRRRLVTLLADPDLSVRRLAARCLSRIARKVPECLHDDPLPPFETGHLRSLLEKLDEPVDSTADLELRFFAREALLRPEALRLWKTDELAAGGSSGESSSTDATEFRAAKLHVALAILHRTDGQWLDEEMLRALRPHGARLRGPTSDLWVDLVSMHAAGQRELLGLIASGSTDLDAALDLLGALKRRGHPRWIDELRSLRASPRDPRLVESLDETIAELDRRRRFLAGGPESRAPSDADLDFLAVSRVPLDLDSPLGGTILERLSGTAPAARVAALRTLSRCPVVRGWERAGPLLLSLLDSSDAATHRGAARALEVLTAFPASAAGQEPGGRIEPADGLPLAAAADPAKVRGSVEAYRRWWTRHRDVAGGPARPEDWHLEALRHVQTWRSVRGAVELRRRARQPETAAWYAQHGQEIRALYSWSELRARLALIGLIESCERTDLAESFLAARLERAFQEREPVECWELLEALHRLARRRTPANRTTDVLGFFAELVSRYRGAAPHLALLDSYLTTRFDREEIDRAFDLRLKGATGPARAQLLRFYPHRPSRARLNTLVDDLADDEFWCRFWALRRLERLAGGERFGFDPEEDPHATENAAAREQWRAWAEAWRPR